MFQVNSSFKKLISSSGVNFIFRIFGLGTSFLTTVLITRFFGVGTFGDYSLVFALSQMTKTFLLPAWTFFLFEIKSIASYIYL